MKNQNYIVLVHFAAKLSRQNLAAVAPIVNQAVRNALGDCEAILATDTSAAFVGTSSASALSLFNEVASGLRPGDQLSVAQLGNAVATSHVGLQQWKQRRPPASV